MKTKLEKSDKGVAGLVILLSLVTMLFVIGLLVMIYSLMGGQLTSTAQTTLTNNATAVDVINDTTVAIASATNFFTIFIVIASMVVLVLLTVIIIVAIRGSGLMSGSA